MIYLYVKIHNLTGLKYLGKTTKNPHKYKGSGKYWKRHLAIHGHDVSTEIIFVSESAQEVRAMGLYYSNLWNVVGCQNWANLIEESGDGGDTSKMIDYDKRRDTVQQKYGTSSVLKSVDIIEKMKVSRMDRYGVPWASQSPEIQNTIRANNIEKYGVDSPNKLDYRRKQVAAHNGMLSNREIVLKLKELKKTVNIEELRRGWYKKPAAVLEEIYLRYSK